MSNTYVLVFLEPGQSAPIGSQAREIDGGIVCIVADEDYTENKLNQIVNKGVKLPGDTDIPEFYSARVMTADEITEFNNPPEAEES